MGAGYDLAVGRADHHSRLETHGSSDADLWQVDVDTKRGTPADKPKRLTQWAGSNLAWLSGSADGKRIVLQKMTFQTQVLLGELAEAGILKSPPSWLTKDEANDLAFTWAADSKAVIVISDRNGRPQLFKQSISEGAAEPLVTGPKAAGLARLSPDGAWVLYMESTWSPATEPAPPFRLMRVPVNGGLPQFVLETRNWWGDFQCARSPVSFCAIEEISKDQKRLTVTAFDPFKGRGKLLRTIELDPSATLGYATGMSPDGSIFAIAKHGEADIHIRLLSLSGGSDREITVRDWPNISSLDWSDDGKGFYCGSTSPEGATLLYVDLRGTAQIVWRDSVANAPGVGISSPDGRYLAIWASIQNSNVWMVEGF